MSPYKTPLYYLGGMSEESIDALYPQTKGIISLVFCLQGPWFSGEVYDLSTGTTRDT